MSKKTLFNVVSQIQVEGAIAAAGTQIELTDIQAEYLLAKGAVEPAPTAPAPTPSPAPVNLTLKRVADKA